MLATSSEGRHLLNLKKKKLSTERCRLPCPACPVTVYVERYAIAYTYGQIGLLLPAAMAVYSRQGALSTDSKCYDGLNINQLEELKAIIRSYLHKSCWIYYCVWITSVVPIFHICNRRQKYATTVKSSHFNRFPLHILYKEKLSTVNCI